jgi:glucokinase
MRVLAGDLGGTKTLLAVAECRASRVVTLVERRYTSATYDGLLPMLHEFLAGAGTLAQGVSSACFAVAGPVSDEAEGETARITNLPWQLDSRALASAIGYRRVRLINDFAGVAHGIAALQPDDLRVLQAGDVRDNAPRLVVGAGTGLGAATLVHCGECYKVLPSEAGHMDLAPLDAEQDAMLTALRAEHGHVSVERLLSGPGLAWIYRFLRTQTPATAASDIADADPAAISSAAFTGDDPCATRAMDHFVRLYGAVVGNLALAVLPRGGIYLAGGIAAKILTALDGGAFIEAMLAKGRLRATLTAMPACVVTQPAVGLHGAALVAANA